MASSSAGSVVAAVVVVLACISLVELVVRPLPSIKHRKDKEADEVVARPEQELAGFEEDLENDLLSKEERERRQQQRRRKKDEVVEDENGGGSDFDDSDFDDGDYGDDEFDWSEADSYGTTKEPIKERRVLTVKLCSSRTTK